MVLLFLAYFAAITSHKNLTISQQKVTTLIFFVFFFSKYRYPSGTAGKRLQFVTRSLEGEELVTLLHPFIALILHILPIV